MQSYETDDRYLALYGGAVKTNKAEISPFGNFEISFRRPINYPSWLVIDYMPDYIEEKKILKPSAKELKEWKEEYN